MSAIQQLLTDHIDIWTAADTEKKSGRGRASGNAPSVYGIKKLRELILELAVRGKLVPQDVNDEPASELLKRIQAEKSKLVADGKFKKDKPLALIKDDERPFDQPHGWEWVRLGEIAETVRGVTYGKSDASDIPLPDHVPLLRGNNINRFLNFDSPVYVPKKLLDEAQYVKAGDIVIAMSSGSADLVGKAAQATEDFDGGFGAFCGVVRSVSAEVLSFFGFFFQTPLYRIRAAGHGKGIGINNLQKTALQTLEIPIPPLAEQHRIVAKVDELMALCDQLETQHNNALDAHEKLVSHLLGTLTHIPVRPELVEGRGSTGSPRTELTDSPQTEFEENWQRIAAHFDTLFTTESSIAALKQTILQLAVMGKLVPQNPNDEPASELLKRIQAEKARLIAEGKIKKDKPLPPIAEEEKLFDLPRGWEWARLQSVIDVRDGTHDSPKEAHGPNTYPLVTSKDFSDGKINYESARRISEVDHLEISKRSLVEKYDILFSMIGGNIGNQVIVEDDCQFSVKNVALFKYYEKKLTFHFFIKKYTENLAVNLQATAIGGAQPFVALGALRNLVIALPPLAEQHRIVAKVDELMSLCDQLKSRITEANQLQQKLADVMVEQAVA